MSNIYFLTQERRVLIDRLKDSYDENDPAFIDTLEAESGDLEEKVLNYAYVAKELEARIAARKTVKSEIEESIKRDNSRVAGMKKALKEALLLIRKTVSGKYFDVSLSGKTKSVIITNEEKLPKKYFRTPPPSKPVPDKAALYDDLMAGKKIEGAELDDGIRIVIK